jgi:hypothetical protein
MFAQKKAAPVCLYGISLNVLSVNKLENISGLNQG